MIPTHKNLMHTFKTSLLALGAALLLAASIAPSALAQEDPPPTPDPRFGAVETYHTPDMADDAGVGWTRIIFYWSELKKDGPDEWNWFHAPLARIDREIAGGREIVGLLKHTPDFATDGLPGAGIPRGLYLPIDDPDNLWADFVREVMTAYQGRVNRWIIWNEPDIALDTYGAQWEGTTADYFQLVKVAALVAEEIDPSIQIHLGGLTYWHNPNYLREFLNAASEDPTAAENGYYFDVVSLHVYFKPETTTGIVAALRETLTEFGIENKPIWINETNAPPYDDPAQNWENPVFQITQEMQAAFLIQEFALALSMGVERIAVYKWIDEPPLEPGFEPYGLLRTDTTARPAYDAFRAITTHYANVRSAERIERPEMQQVLLDRGELTTRVLWARTVGGVTVTVPALADSALLVDQTGQETRITARGGTYTLTMSGAPCTEDAECLMGGPPLLLIEEAAANLEDWASFGATVTGAAPPGDSFTTTAAANSTPPLDDALTTGEAENPVSAGVILGVSAMLLGGMALAFLWAERRKVA